VKHQPPMDGAYGRFLFKPVTKSPSKIYAGFSTLAYTFGDLAFSSYSRCKVKSESGELPGNYL